MRAGGGRGGSAGTRSRLLYGHFAGVLLLAGQGAAAFAAEH